LTLKTFLPEELAVPSQTKPNGPKQPLYSLLKTSLNFQAAVLADLIHGRNFNDAKTWRKCVGAYMSAWLNEEKGIAFAESIRTHYLAIDKVCIIYSPSGNQLIVHV